MSIFFDLIQNKLYSEYPSLTILNFNLKKVLLNSIRIFIRLKIYKINHDTLRLRLVNNHLKHNGIVESW